MTIKKDPLLTPPTWSLSPRREVDHGLSTYLHIELNNGWDAEVTHTNFDIEIIFTHMFFGVECGVIMPLAGYLTDEWYEELKYKMKTGLISIFRAPPNDVKRLKLEARKLQERLVEIDGLLERAFIEGEES